MKALNIIAKGIPVAEVVNLMGTIFTHMQAMEQIKSNHRLESRRQRKEYKLAKKRLEDEAKRFGEMMRRCDHILLQNAQDRQWLLQTAERLIDRMLVLPDRERYRDLERTLFGLLEKHTHSLEAEAAQLSGLLGSSRPALMGGVQ
jgi:hypothetical protein